MRLPLIIILRAFQRVNVQLLEVIAWSTKFNEVVFPLVRDDLFEIES